jgi:hypothetical protein
MICLCRTPLMTRTAVPRVACCPPLRTAPCNGPFSRCLPSRAPRHAPLDLCVQGATAPKETSNSRNDCAILSARPFAVVSACPRGSHFCPHDSNDGARPITPDPHLLAKGVTRDWFAGCCSVLSVEFSSSREEIAGQSWASRSRTAASVVSPRSASKRCRADAAFTVLPRSNQSAASGPPHRPGPFRTSGVRARRTC